MERYYFRGIRGATTVEHNDRMEILEGTKELLKTIIEENEVLVEDVAGIHFSMTEDLDQEFPALAARHLGWNYVPMICYNEITTPHGLKKCIRLLMYVNTTKSQDEIKHIYLKEAKNLRPDLFER